MIILSVLLRLGVTLMRLGLAVGLALGTLLLLAAIGVLLDWRIVVIGLGLAAYAALAWAMLAAMFGDRR